MTKDRYEPWDPKLTYVIGHQRPDTDTIAAALGYAWFLTATGQENTIAARAGNLGPQALFALRRFEQAAPRLLPDVAPTFGHAARHQIAVSPDDQLPAAMSRLAEGDRVIPVVDADGHPTGLVTPLALARAYTAMNVLEMLAQPCQSIAEKTPTFYERDRISDHRSALLRSDKDDFMVIDEAGRYVGVATRSRVLEPRRARLILVDHNELSQAVAGAAEAEIVSVLDHHRLGNPPTAAPIPFIVEPVGSTATLVAEQCHVRSLPPPVPLAGMLLSGILSDTLLFRSPTTTDRDRAMAEWLAPLAKVDINAYGTELMGAAPGLTARTAEEIVDGDRKSYQFDGLTLSIGQVEVNSLQELPQRRAELLEALDQRLHSEGLGLICLMITDVVAERSVLLCRGDGRLLAALPFRRTGEYEFNLGDMVSRKKQLVPALHAALEEAR